MRQPMTRWQLTLAGLRGEPWPMPVDLAQPSGETVNLGCVDFETEGTSPN